MMAYVVGNFSLNTVGKFPSLDLQQASSRVLSYDGITTQIHPQRLKKSEEKLQKAEYRVNSHQEFTEECLQKNLTPRGIRVKVILQCEG